MHVLARAARARARRRAPPARGPDRRAAARALRARPRAPPRAHAGRRRRPGASPSCAPCAPTSRRSSWPTATRRGASARRSRRSWPSASRCSRRPTRRARRTASGASARTSRCGSRIDVVGSRPLTIIDGHHRYETALAYRDERRAADGEPDELQAYDFAPVYLANRHDPGLMLFPTHRVVDGLSPELWERLPELLAERWELEEVADVDALERRVVAPVARRALVRARARQRRAAAARAPARRAAVGARRRRGRDARAATTCSASTPLPSRPPIASPIAAAPTTPRALVDAAPPRTAVALLVPAPTRRRRRGRRRGRPDDAAEVDVLLPEDPRRHGLQPARSVRPVTAEHWLEVCRAMRDAVVAAVAEVPRARRADELGRGAGGDLTVAIDQAAEDAALARARARVAAAGEGFTVVSEEVGERSFGGGGPLARRDRPDRRQPQRQARPAAVRALGRDRRRAGDGRRRARLRLRPRQRRGVDRAARRRGDRRRRRRSARRVRSPACSSSRSRRRGPSTSRRPPPRCPARSSACACSARSRSRSATSPTAASTPSRACGPNGARSIDIAAAQLAVREAGNADRAAGRRRARSATRRSTSSAARASSPPATTTCVARVAGAARHRRRGGPSADPG